MGRPNLVSRGGADAFLLGVMMGPRVGRTGVATPPPAPGVLAGVVAV